MDLMEIGWKVWNGFIWLRIGADGRLVEHSNEHSGSTEDREFEWL
jgi:hypothetical protein